MPNNTVKISISANTDFTLHSNDIEIIVRDYQGDVKKYIEDNWKKFVYFDGLDFELDNIDLRRDDTEKNLKEEIESYRKFKKLEDHRSLLFKFNREVKGEVTDGIKKMPEIIISKKERESLGKVYHVAKKEGSNDIHKEINYVHLQNGIATATDEQRIIKSDSGDKEASTNELFIPPHFAMMLSGQEESILYIHSQGDREYLSLVYKGSDDREFIAEHLLCNSFNESWHKKMSEMEFPDVDKVIESLHTATKTFSLKKDFDLNLTSSAIIDPDDTENTITFHFEKGINPKIKGYQYKEIDFTLYDEIRYSSTNANIYFVGKRKTVPDEVLVLSVIWQENREG